MSSILEKLHPHHTQTTTSTTGAPLYTNVSQSQGLYNTGVSTAEPIIERTVVGAPVVQETIRNDRVVEVQPVIHRNVDQTVVHHIEKHITEPAAPTMGGAVYERNPIVEQTVHTQVVNEIQPIIHRERVVPVTERVEQHLMERVAEPTVHTHEVVYENAATTTFAPTTTYSGTSTTFQQPSATTARHHGLLHRH